LVVVVVGLLFLFPQIPSDQTNFLVQDVANASGGNSSSSNVSGGGSKSVSGTKAFKGSQSADHTTPTGRFLLLLLLLQIAGGSTDG